MHDLVAHPSSCINKPAGVSNKEETETADTKKQEHDNILLFGAKHQLIQNNIVTETSKAILRVCLVNVQYMNYLPTYLLR